MERRSFIKKAGVGVAAGAVAAPALAAELPTIKWRLASSFPKSLDTIYGGADVMAKRVAAATGGKFQIQVFAAGEIVPGPGVMDAVKDGTVEVGHTCSYYFIGKDPTFAFDTAVPFGLNSRQQTAWMMEGGGLELFREFFKDYNIHNIPCGNTGAQMGGWFRKEIKSVEDLKGLKFRCGGFAGQVLAKLGVVPQQIPGGDIYPALEKGTIDAAEWIGPYDDLKLGLHRVAPYYYYPAWWEGSTQFSVYINSEKWQSLSKDYQAIVAAAASAAHVQCQARYDARNPGALKQLVAEGAKLSRFPKDVMDAAFKAAQEVYKELDEKNANWKKVYPDYSSFLAQQVQWQSVAEANYSQYLAAQKL